MPVTDFHFYLGTNNASWLWRDATRHRLFVSHRTLRKYKKFRRAQVSWCLDSGGFTEISLHGRWVTTPEQYVESVRRYYSEIGSLVWVAPQDYMCEPSMLTKTGLTVAEHQHLTCANFATLREIAPDLPFIPVLQGWSAEDYFAHLNLYRDYGFDLIREPVVGVGSVCRRATVTGIAEMFRDLATSGLRLHGFGLKSDAIRLFGDSLISSDSMAWSLRARMAGRDGLRLCGIEHENAKSCSSCIIWAHIWADNLLRSRASYV